MNKTAIKVFLIIGMIVGAILIYPLVLGIIAYQKVEEAKRPEDLKTWGVVVLIFVNLIAGILMLSVKEDIACDSDMQKTQTNKYEKQVSRVDKDEDLNKLLKLKELYDNGVIPKEVYEKKRDNYLEKL